MTSHSTLPSSLSGAQAFEHTLWANGPAASDPFYIPPSGSVHARPGSLLKVEVSTNASNYSLAAGIAISRIMYQSQIFNGTFHGTSVPASAYVLWPYQARTRSDGSLPVVGWAHGTSGLYGNCAPSNLKTLWDHFRAPYPLALQGYVVVAPDYVGLGVAKTADGQEIVHQYLANPAHANDLFYAIEAAQSAFRELSSEFVFMGHSQGGGAAWGAAQRQAIKPVKGYLGAIALSPVTDILELPATENPLIPVLGAFLTPGIKSLFPEFDPSSIFTEIGWERFQAYGRTQGCNSVAIELLTGFQLLDKNWMHNKYVQKYIQLTSNGGKEIGGPLLVI